MSATGGFWPGEAPAAEEEDAQDGEAPVEEPDAWPQRREEKASEETGGKTETAATTVAETAEAEETEEEPEPEEPEVPPAGHVPGELDIPDVFAQVREQAKSG